jgi:phosphoserine phosphatase
VADLILFREESFDYARSVSTIRHSVDAAWHAAVIGLLFLAVTFPLYVSPNVGWWSLVKFVFCPLFGVILAGCIVKRVGQRRAFADSDYAARYLLLTVLNSSAYRVDELGTKDLPKGVTDWFDGQERRRSSFALLDMDETLIHGDVAESLLQLFEGNGWQPRLTGDTDGVDATRREVWKEYQRKLKESTNGAYRYSTSILEGMSPEDIAKHTNELLIQEYGGKLLRARPEAKALVRFLELSGIRCYVVTASNQWSAEVVAWNWFGIPRQRVIGVRPELEKSGCLGRLGEETQPIGAKKLDCFRSRTEVKTDPAVVAGDSESDLSLFNACRQDGLRILVGNNPRVESLINSPRPGWPSVPPLSLSATLA